MPISGPGIVSLGSRRPGLTIFKSAAAAFTPSSISGLALWLKADAGTSTTTDGVAVATWSDQSGNARDATATAGKQALYKTNILNGKPVLRFDGVDDFFTTAAFALAGGATPTGITIFGVGTLTALGSFPMLAVWHTSTNELRANAGTGKAEFSAVGSTSGTGTGVNLVGTGAHVLCGRFLDSADTAEVFVDGVSKSSGATGATALTSTAQAAGIGARTGGTLPWTGDIAEVLIYNTDLSTANRNAVQAYLKAKYGTP